YLELLRRTEAGEQPHIPVTDDTYHGAILNYGQVADTMALHQQAQIIDHCAGIRRDGIGSGELFHRNLNGQHGNSPVNHREMRIRLTAWFTISAGISIDPGQAQRGSAISVRLGGPVTTGPAVTHHPCSWPMNKPPDAACHPPSR